MTSIFNVFKIDIAPSSSHTTGPMRGALRFVEELAAEDHLSITTRIRLDLYGSLALTGERPRYGSRNHAWSHRRTA
jgi:L-serine dehydratase